MKNTINSVLLVLATLVNVLPLSGCVSNGTIDATASSVTIVLRLMTVRISDLPSSVPYKIRNTSSRVITVESHYEIERYEGTYWISFPFSPDDPPNWPEGNIQLEPGTYRVVKEVAEADKPYIKLYAEFVVG